MINIYFGLIFETTSSYNYLYMTMNQYIVNILEIFVDFNYNHNLIITSKKRLFPYEINDKSPENYIYIYIY